MPRWKKVTLTVFAFVFLAGAAIKASSFFREKGGAFGGQKVVSDQKTLTDGVRERSGESGFVAGRPSPPMEGEREPGEAEGEEKAIEDWSPILLKGSMSFFLGFCIGYALRTFFRISAVVIGLVALAIFGLSYAGFIQPDWTAMEEQFNRIVGNLREQAGGFKDFLAGSLPSAALATAGLFTGFKR